MEKTLVIMAAGLGSRFGGMKQIAPVDDYGHILMDYSVYDAHKAGFNHVVCIIKPENKQDFHEAIGKRIENQVDLTYAFQTTDKLPDGYTVPEGRTKPWGTAHAVLCAKNVIKTPFAVINADDYYGPGAFKAAADFLDNSTDASEHAMVGYRIENTLTENGYVSRGVCNVDENGFLTGVTERTKIIPQDGGAAFTEDGENFTFVPAGTMVSMNLWSFKHEILDEIESRFAPWLDVALKENPLKGEYYLPLIPNALINENKGTVKVLSTDEKWYGVTYSEDMPVLHDALMKKHDAGQYPHML